MVLRTGIEIALFVVMGILLIVRLYTLQIVNGENYLNNFAMSIKKTRELPSTRGQIYDVNGNLLAYNELTHNVTFQDNGTYSSTHDHNVTLNGILYRTIRMIESHGDSIYTNFHIILTEDGN